MTQLHSDASQLPALRELLAVREIAHAFLVADRPEDVHQFALDRVTPLLGAAFSIVMRLGDDGMLLRPVAQHEWPLRYRAWIGALRVRVGSGPSGMAVEQRQVVEIANLFADPSLSEWYEVAEELGFRSIVAAPLISARGPIGAITFYFATETEVTEDQRALVRLVADQLAATGDKAALIEELRRSNAALADANSQLERLANDAEAARITRDRFVEKLAGDIMELLDEGEAPAGDVARAASITQVTRELVQAERGQSEFVIGDVDPRTPLLDAVARARAQNPALPIVLAEPTVMLPTIRSDERWLRRLYEVVLTYATHRSNGTDVSVHVSMELGRGFVANRFVWIEADADVQRVDIELTLSRAMAQHLGGEMQFERSAHDDRDELTLTLIFPTEVSSR